MDSLPDFVLFIGRFHPLVVHLPIGFLFFAFLLELISRWKNDPVLTSAIPLALLSGAISAAIACVLGYLLSLSGDYEEEMLDSHMWFGLVTTAVAFLAWLVRIETIKIQKLRPNVATLALVIILLSITGHYGGNLTHGSDYLVKYMPFGAKEKKELPPIAKVEDAVVYEYLVDPILQNRCGGCHNSGKKKGSLSYEDRTSLLKGGKNGPVLVSGNAAESEMIRRVLLAPDDEDFMPPKGKTPLTEDEIAIISYWIENANADFSKNIASVETPENIMEIASNSLNFEVPGKKGAIKLPQVNTVEVEVLNNIINEGFRVRELIFESGLYEIVLPAKTITENNAKELDEKLKKLGTIKENILWLNLEDNQVNDSHMIVIGQFNNLQKLVLNKNPITDASMAALTNQPNLNNINLYDTKVTKASLESFSKMQNLQHVYVWKTTINKEDVEAYKEDAQFPKIIFGM